MIFNRIRFLFDWWWSPIKRKDPRWWFKLKSSIKLWNEFWMSMLREAQLAFWPDFDSHCCKTFFILQKPSLMVSKTAVLHTLYFIGTKLIIVNESHEIIRHFVLIYFFRLKSLQLFHLFPSKTKVTRGLMSKTYSYRSCARIRSFSAGVRQYRILPDHCKLSDAIWYRHRLMPPSLITW